MEDVVDNTAMLPTKMKNVGARKTTAKVVSAKKKPGTKKRTRSENGSTATTEPCNADTDAPASKRPKKEACVKQPMKKKKKKSASCSDGGGGGDHQPTTRADRDALKAVKVHVRGALNRAFNTSMVKRMSAAAGARSVTELACGEVCRIFAARTTMMCHALGVRFGGEDGVHRVTPDNVAATADSLGFPKNISMSKERVIILKDENKETGVDARVFYGQQRDRLFVAASSFRDVVQETVSGNYNIAISPSTTMIIQSYVEASMHGLLSLSAKLTNHAKRTAIQPVDVKFAESLSAIGMNEGATAQNCHAQCCDETTADDGGAAGSDAMYE